MSIERPTVDRIKHFSQLELTISPRYLFNIRIYLNHITIIAITILQNITIIIHCLIYRQRMFSIKYVFAKEAALRIGMRITPMRYILEICSGRRLFGC